MLPQSACCLLLRCAWVGSQVYPSAKAEGAGVWTKPGNHRGARAQRETDTMTAVGSRTCTSRSARVQQARFGNSTAGIMYGAFIWQQCRLQWAGVVKARARGGASRAHASGDSGYCWSPAPPLQAAGSAPLGFCGGGVSPVWAGGSRFSPERG
eukprot:697391-Amphidinium_carterae.3